MRVGGKEEADHAAESLLSCRVPELEADFEAVDVNLLGDEEGTSGGRHVPGIKLVLCIPMEKTGLSNAYGGITVGLRWIL